MKQSEPLAPVAPGTLPRPGPIGRLVRLVIGGACLYAVHELVVYHEDIIVAPFSNLANLAVLIAVAACVFNHVVNIGFGRSWRMWPVITASGTLIGVALLSLAVFAHWLFGAALWSWLLYTYGHLGVSFVLAASIGTPGCEMRAIPQLFGKITGRSTDEHACPATFITAIDEWERGRKSF